MGDHDEVLTSAATSASYNIVLQLLFRVLTFLLNAFVLRFISQQTLGVVNVRLTLLYSTILFVSREAFRRACLSKSSSHSWQHVINLLWCIFPIGCLTSLIFSFIWVMVLEQPDSTDIPYYNVAVAGYALSAVIEILSEPLFVVAQILLYVRLKVVIEGVSLMIRCFLTTVLIFVFPNSNLLAFTAAQLSLTTATTLFYYLYITYLMKSSKRDTENKFPFTSIKQLLPRYVGNQSLFNPELSSLTWSFFKQSFLKQILTEGEKYMMTVFDLITFADQGVYDIISNLASLIPRFIFLPLEDSSYLLFTQIMKRQREQNTKDQTRFACDILSHLLKIVILFGLTLCVYSMAYSFTALHIYGGSILSQGSGPLLLRCYSVYVLLLAVNGITEAFVFATMSQRQVDKYNHKMFIFSVLFLLSSLCLVNQFGSVGFIYANCFNMSIRIAHSIVFIHGYFSNEPNNPLIKMLPSSLIVGSFALSLIATVWTEHIFDSRRSTKGMFIHLLVGGICLLLNIACIIIKEKDLIQFLWNQYKKTRHKEKAL